MLLHDYGLVKQAKRMKYGGCLGAVNGARCYIMKEWTRIQVMGGCLRNEMRVDLM